MTRKRFSSVWDAIEDSHAQAENMKLRSELMIALKDHILRENLSQAQAAGMLTSAIWRAKAPPKASMRGRL